MEDKSISDAMKNFEKIKKTIGLKEHLFYMFCSQDEALEKRLDFLNAVTGNMIQSENKELQEISYARKNGIIDDLTYHNFLVTVSDSDNFENNPIKAKQSGEAISKLDLLKLESYAKESVEIVCKYYELGNTISNIYDLARNEKNKELEYALENTFYANSVFKDITAINMNTIEDLHNKINSFSDNKSINKKAVEFYAKGFEFIQDRDVYKSK